MTAYYNDVSPESCAWLTELAAAFVAAVMEHIAVAGKLIREEGATC